MEAALATIASLFAVIQGSVWLIELTQKRRAKKSASEYALHLSMARNLAEARDAPQGTAVSAPENFSAPAMQLPPTGPRVTDSHWSSSVLNPASQSNHNAYPASGSLEPRSPTPEPVLELRKSQSRIGRMVRGIWHGVLIAFLPVFAFLSPMGLAVAVLLPFRDSVANPSFYDEGPGTTLIYSLILLIPGIFAFRYPPTNSLHKWVRRISLALAVFIAILFFSNIAFIEPSG